MAGAGQKAICGGQPGPGEAGVSLGPNSGVGGVNLSVPGLSNVNIKLNLSSPPQPPSDARVISQCLPAISLSLRRAGYSEEVADEVTGALGTLSVHGVLQLTPGSDHAVTTDPVFLPPPPQTPPVASAGSQGPFGPAGLVPAPAVASNQGQPPPPVVTVGHYPPRPVSDDVTSLISPGLASMASGHTVGPQFPSLPVNNNSFGLATAGNPLPPPPEPSEHGLAKVDIEVSESLVGAVLGPAGRSIIEIQQFSGANIQISKKGMYSPGTRNRIVTVTGSQKAINTAKFLIELKVQDEESKRQFNAGINMC